MIAYNAALGACSRSGHSGWYKALQLVRELDDLRGGAADVCCFKACLKQRWNLWKYEEKSWQLMTYAVLLWFRCLIWVWWSKFRNMLFVFDWVWFTICTHKSLVPRVKLLQSDSTVELCCDKHVANSVSELPGLAWLWGYISIISSKSLCSVSARVHCIYAVAFISHLHFRTCAKYSYTSSEDKFTNTCGKPKDITSPKSPQLGFTPSP